MGALSDAKDALREAVQLPLQHPRLFQKGSLARYTRLPNCCPPCFGLCCTGHMTTAMPAVAAAAAAAPSVGNTEQFALFSYCWSLFVFKVLELSLLCNSSKPLVCKGSVHKCVSPLAAGLAEEYCCLAHLEQARHC